MCGGIKYLPCNSCNRHLPFYQKALLICEKYTAVKNVTYRTSATGRVNKIDYKILQTASDEITQSSQFQFPDEDNLLLQKRHKNCENLLAAQ